MQIDYTNPITLRADEGMILTNGETYTEIACLGINDSPENWYEISENEVPPEEQQETNYEEIYEALQVLLGK